MWGFSGTSSREDVRNGPVSVQKMEAPNVLRTFVYFMYTIKKRQQNAIAAKLCGASHARFGTFFSPRVGRFFSRVGRFFSCALKFVRWVTDIIFL
jgi:hypothetical protein